MTKCKTKCVAPARIPNYVFSKGPTGNRGFTGPAGTVDISSIGTSVFFGTDAGSVTPGTKIVALGFESGKTSIGDESVIIGSEAGKLDSGNNVVTIGHSASTTGQGDGALSIGHLAGSVDQGASSVAIGLSSNDTSAGINSVGIGAYSDANSTNYSISIGRNSSVSQGDYAISIGLNSKVGDSSYAANSICMTSQGSSIHAGGIHPTGSSCIINWDRVPGVVPGGNALATRAAGRMWTGQLPQQPGGAATLPTIPTDCPAGWSVLLYDTNSGEMAVGPLSV